SDAEGRPRGLSGTTHDITSRKQVELELGRLLAERGAEAEELRQLHRRLQRSLEALLGIHEVGKLLISVSDLDAVGRRVLEIALRAARLKAAALRRRTPAGRLRLWQQAEDWAGTHPLSPTAAVRRARALTLATGQTASVPARRRPGAEAG